MYMYSLYSYQLSCIAKDKLKSQVSTEVNVSTNTRVTRMPCTLRIARPWRITMVQVCLRLEGWATWGAQIHPLNNQVLGFVSGYIRITNLIKFFLESIHSTLQDIRFEALFVLPSLPTECSSAYSSNTRVNSGLSWMLDAIPSAWKIVSMDISAPHSGF